MRARRQTRPTRSLPILSNRQPLQLEGVIDRNDAVNLTVRVLVVLTRVDFLRVEEDCCDGHVECGRGGRRYL
jgi:hypothetical protein